MGRHEGTPPRKKFNATSGSAVSIDSPLSNSMRTSRPSADTPRCVKAMIADGTSKFGQSSVTHRVRSQRLIGTICPLQYAIPVPHARTKTTRRTREIARVGRHCSCRGGLRDGTVIGQSSQADADDGAECRRGHCAGRFAGRCHGRSCSRGEAHGEASGAHPQTVCRRNPRFGHGHLFRQDRNADRKSDGRDNSGRRRLQATDP